MLGRYGFCSIYCRRERESGRASKRAEAIFAVTMATTHSQPPTPAAGSSPAGLKGFSARYRGNPVAPQLRPSPPGCTSSQGTLGGLRVWYPDGAACTLGGHPEQRDEHVCCSLQTRWQGRGWCRASEWEREREEAAAALAALVVGVVFVNRPAGGRRTGVRLMAPARSLRKFCFKALEYSLSFLLLSKNLMFI